MVAGIAAARTSDTGGSHPLAGLHGKLAVLDVAQATENSSIKTLWGTSVKATNGFSPLRSRWWGCRLSEMP